MEITIKDLEGLAALAEKWAAKKYDGDLTAGVYHHHADELTEELNKLAHKIKQAAQPAHVGDGRKAADSETDTVSENNLERARA